MFRRLSNDLPPDPSYPADLTGLGFTLTPEGHFVKASDPTHQAFFDFFHTDNERANEVRKEAIHECARSTVLSQLETLGIKPLYLDESGYQEAKPDDPHVTILTTELKTLKTKKDVVVVIGEAVQDLGIWAYRILMRGGGIDEGSAVGLAKKLQRLGASKGRQDSIADTSIIGKALRGLRLSHSGPDLPPSEFKHTNTPGLIILNPGQLFYSHKLKKCMSQATWLGRPRINALSDPYMVDPIHNRVPGHRTPDEHATTVFKSITPALTTKDVRLYIVGISEGGEVVLNYLDRTLLANSSAAIGGNLEAIALMQPSHQPAQLRSPALATFLHARGRSWVMSSGGRPKGTLLATPDALSRPTTHQSVGQLVENEKPEVNPSAVAAQIQAAKDNNSIQELNPADHAVEDLENNIDGDLPKLISAACAAQDNSAAGHDEELISPSTTTPPIPIPGRPRGSTIGSESAGLTTDYKDLQSSTTSPESFPKPPAAIEQSIASLQTNFESQMEQSASTLSKSNPNLEASDTSLPPNPYADDDVSCPTFSSGVEEGVVEVIWPAVMDDVLTWFESLAEDAREREKAKA